MSTKVYFSQSFLLLFSLFSQVYYFLFLLKFQGEIRPSPPPPSPTMPLSLTTMNVNTIFGEGYYVHQIYILCIAENAMFTQCIRQTNPIHDLICLGKVHGYYTTHIYRTRGGGWLIHIFQLLHFMYTLAQIQNR